MSTTSTSGWNRPRQNAPKATSKKPNAMRGVVAGLVVVALAAACVVVFMGKGEKPVEKVEKKPAKIKEVTPAKAPTYKAVKVEKEKKILPQRVGEVRDGKRLLCDGRLIPVTPTITTSRVVQVTAVDRAFPQWTDRRIANLLDMEPGESLVGDSASYFRDFNEDFKKSLETPIEYDKNDSQYIKELKISVQQMREELKARLEKGEDIGKTLMESREQLRELGLYRRELEQQVIELTQERGLSQEDYDAMIEAANKMLAERGSKPLELPKLVKERIRISAEKKKGDNK